MGAASPLEASSAPGPLPGTAGDWPPSGSGVVVVGALEVARRTCGMLSTHGVTVQHLLAPSDAELKRALGGDVRAVAVLVRGDVVALRYALLVAHLRPDLELVVTLFDRTLTTQLRQALPRCVVTSPADIAVPAIVRACLSPDPHHAAPGVKSGLRLPGRRFRGSTGAGAASRVLHRVLGQFRPHDVDSRMLLTGLFGLGAALMVEWLLGLLGRGESATTSLDNAARVVATVGPGRSADGSSWASAVSSTMMLLSIGFTALFTAGLVGRASSFRTIGIVGRRTVPRANHVVVVGLGQVGYRLCRSLKAANVAVLAVERDPGAPNLRLAKAAGIPVLIAHAEDRAVLAKLSLPRARALAAMSSSDLDNVEIAMAALAVRPGLRTVLRAGEDDVIAETRSLFHIGQVCDVSAMTAAAVFQLLNADPPRYPAVKDGTARCDCA